LKGTVEASVCYIKHNALAGRAGELIYFEDYLALAPVWHDQVVNVRTHETSEKRPIKRFEREHLLLHKLPTMPFNSDEVVPAVVSGYAQVEFDGKQYSMLPRLVCQTVTIRASCDELDML
jgi:hypothetical protein